MSRALAALLCAWIALVVLASPARAEMPPVRTVPDAAPDLAGLEGRPLTRVDVVVGKNPWNVGPPKVTSARAAAPLTPELARRALAEVLATGRFAGGAVSAEADGAGARLTIHVAARKVIDAVVVELHGTQIDREEVLRETDLSEGGEVTGAGLAAEEAALKKLLSARGYPNARVTILVAPHDEDLVTVAVAVWPGPERTVAKRFFYVYEAEARRLDTLTSKYEVKEGDRADETALEAADGKLSAALRGRGYHRAAVSHDLVEQDGRSLLRVRIDAGPLFSPRFEGNDHYDADALTGALGLEDDGDRSPAKLVQKIEDFYRKRGFLDVAARVETRGTEKDRVRLLVFHVVEGPRVAVTSRAYPCLKEADIAKLSEGGPQSAQEIGNEIDSFVEEDVPGADLVRSPDPAGLDRTLGTGASRVTPVELDPDDTFFAPSYERALEHVRDLYRNEGFLHAEVGPVEVLRRRCHPRSPPGECVPVPFPHAPADACTYDPASLPLPVPAADPALGCKPDPARGITCEPRVTLRIPVKLGPRTFLHDVAFAGATKFTERVLARAARLPMGEAVSALKLEEASRRVLDAYKDEGYAFADVRYALEPSPDHTRARVRFDINEGEQVIVRGVVIQGNRLTQEQVIAARVVLEPGKPYRAVDVRKTQERIATLGVFESVEVGLEDPQVPQKRKMVIVRVSERTPQYFEVRPGVASGEGLRLLTEYGHRNMFGKAIGLSLRGQIAYLPDFMIFDEEVRKSFNDLTPAQRFTLRGTLTASFPDIGIGPLWRSQVDTVIAQDLQRGFLLQKTALIPAVAFRPVKEVELSLSQSAEYNYQRLLGTAAQISATEEQRATNSAIARLLNVPEGPSVAFAQRFTVTWDRRDNAFSAHRGTYLVASIEHVDSFGLHKENGTPLKPRTDGHFLRLTQTFSAYLPLPRRLVLAATLRVGQIIHLISRERSKTYPDRLFFLGGAESVRGFPQDQLAPADVAALDPTKNPGIVGGDLMVNPRLELRIPVWASFETVAFFDAGNVWKDPFSIKDIGDLVTLRTAAGTGIRWNSPVGVPVVFDIGWNLLPLPYERRQNEPFRYEIHFAMGLF